MRSLSGFAFLIIASAAIAQQPPALPPGEGHDIVAVACTQCHGPGPFAQLRQGPEAWRSLVHDMVLRGAQVQPSEVNPVVNYLTAHFGPGNNVPPPMHAVSLPEGQGKDLVAQRCALCHGLDRVAMAKRSPAEWDAILTRMSFLGAPLDGQDRKLIRAYLGANFETK